MENNILDIKTDNDLLSNNSTFDPKQYYKSIDHMQSLINTFEEKSQIINNTFHTLKEGKITKELSFTQRDELITSLEKEKSNLEQLFVDYIQSLENDIDKLDKRRINSSVDIDIFNDYIPEESPKETRITSSFFHKLKK
ncbi:hypothetical protein ACFYSI_13005 [Staphylococcus xylosus]|uniref:hypothetical protein n=1 Tax=Staphylococcus xylosus TaxID=1288 RepID=UPI0036BA7292